MIIYLWLKQQVDCSDIHNGENQGRRNQMRSCYIKLLVQCPAQIDTKEVTVLIIVGILS